MCSVVYMVVFIFFALMLCFIKLNKIAGSCSYLLTYIILIEHILRKIKLYLVTRGKIEGNKSNEHHGMK